MRTFGTAKYKKMPSLKPGNILKLLQLILITDYSLFILTHAAPLHYETLLRRQTHLPARDGIYQ